MDITDNTKETLHNKYDAEPVVYCKHCLSLAIRILDENTDYCDDCGSTDTESTNISLWENLYKEKKGTTLISKNNGR